jgi:predicted esterase
MPQVIIAQAPKHTARFTPFIDDNINGFWEYLPRNYKTDVNTKYPLIIFLHGYGEQGTEQTKEEIEKVLDHGTPELIDSKGFPESYKVNGSNFRFIVISPQIKNGLVDQTTSVSPLTIEAVIQYAKSAYRVDPGRIYLIGLSMGGGAVWSYAGSSVKAARQLAGIAIACGSYDLSNTEAANIASADLPVLVCHNTVDDVVLVERTRNNISRINKYKPSRAPKAFYWSTPGSNNYPHNVWSRMFEDILPGTTEGGNLRDSIGMNVYEWLLQFSTITEDALSLEWVSFNVEPTPKGILLNWEFSSPQTVLSYTVEKSPNGNSWKSISTIQPSSTPHQQTFSYADTQLYEGMNFYRVLEIGKDGERIYTPVIQYRKPATHITSTVYPNPFTDNLYVSVADSISSIQITDAQGKLIYTKSINNYAPNTAINIDNLGRLKSGIYHLAIRNREARVVAVKSLVKQ